MIRCRWCPWSHEPTEDAFDRLRDHVADEHIDEFLDLEALLDDHEAARLGGGA